MKFRIVVVGRPAAGPMRDLVDEYERRASKYWPMEIVEVRAAPGKSRAAAEVRRLEAEHLSERVKGTLVAMDERGKSLTTDAFARWVSERRERAEDTTFVIGGAFGLDPSLRDRAKLVLSLSSWTFPHEIARLVLAEQLYRAGTIQRGEPYHKGD